MLDMLRDLTQHKIFANASLLKAIRQCEPAAQDEELRKLLHHILVANRYWLKLILDLPFVSEEETHVPESLEAIAAVYRETHKQEMEWISKASEAALSNRLESPFIPGHDFSVAEILMQVCMHSHGHRAQCAIKLRQSGGTPPAMDYITWLKERPSADWS
jgi:uncharacterized damage-inducible protein DinB